jgi:hypothetical protein
MRAPREVARLREALADLAIHLTAVMRAAWSETLAHDRARNRETLEAALGGAAAGAVILFDDGATRGVWTPPAEGGSETALERQAMADLAARFAADPALAADWRALALAERGAVIAVDAASGKAERVCGSAAAARAWEAGR